MTEKEKAVAGMLYRPADDQMSADLMRCKELCHRYNHLFPSQRGEREAVLREILGGAGQDIVIEQPFFCDYGFNIAVGDHFYANHGLVILDVAKVCFGNYVFVGPNCGFYTAGHPLAAEERRMGVEFARPIAVGDDVWLGGNVSVMPGVTIGDGAVIGAGSVVTRDIPSGVLAVGNPCRVLRPVTSADRMLDMG